MVVVVVVVVVVVDISTCGRGWLVSSNGRVYGVLCCPKEEGIRNRGRAFADLGSWPTEERCWSRREASRWRRCGSLVDLPCLRQRWMAACATADPRHDGAAITASPRSPPPARPLTVDRDGAGVQHRRRLFHPSTAPGPLQHPVRRPLSLQMHLVLNSRLSKRLPRRRGGIPCVQSTWQWTSRQLPDMLFARLISGNGIAQRSCL